MAQQKIIIVPNKVLKQKSKPVKKIDKKTKDIIKDLKDTVKSASDPEGIGLSAVQINKLVRIFIAKINNHFEIFINPKITFSKKTLTQILPKKKHFFEGCLSVPKIYGFIDRPYQIQVEWKDENGKTKKQTFKGKESICLQHEIDHLNGILFVERVLEQNNKLYKLIKDENDKDVFEEIEVK